MKKAYDIAQITIFAALYAVLIYIFAAISFNALPIRVAGVLGPGTAKKKLLAVGYALGVLIGCFFSPFGAYEVLFMPAVSLFACLLGYAIAKPFKHSYFVTGAVIATISSVSLSLILNQVLNMPLIVIFPYLFIIDQIIAFSGSVMFNRIEKRFKWWEAQI